MDSRFNINPDINIDSNDYNSWAVNDRKEDLEDNPPIPFGLTLPNGTVLFGIVRDLTQVSPLKGLKKKRQKGKKRRERRKKEDGASKKDVLCDLADSVDDFVFEFDLLLAPHCTKDQVEAFVFWLLYTIENNSVELKKLDAGLRRIEATAWIESHWEKEFHEKLNSLEESVGLEVDVRLLIQLVIADLKAFFAAPQWKKLLDAYVENPFEHQTNLFELFKDFCVQKYKAEVLYRYKNLLVAGEERLNTIRTPLMGQLQRIVEAALKVHLNGYLRAHNRYQKALELAERRREKSEECPWMRAAKALYRLFIAE